MSCESIAPLQRVRVGYLSLYLFFFQADDGIRNIGVTGVQTCAHPIYSGLIPELVKEGFKGKIFCTSATRDLAAILLEDSAVIQRDDTKYINRKRMKKGLPLFEPMYTIEDARAAIQFFNTIDYDTWFKLTEDVDILFTDAGHIIGSAVISLKIKEKGKTTAITFSGDVGRY